VACITKLQETLGDKQAKQMVDECMHHMRSLVAQYHGRVINTLSWNGV
jgi:hypothetical protein